jgi:4-amino-4-deoxy-L-arabinose transferase-like glycosyltransferase
VTGDRPWLVAAGAIAGLALVGRIHDAFTLPPLQDFDGAGHALNAVALHAGRLPDPTTWAGFHPPLYYALGAVVWALLPESVPVHVGLRLISVAAGIGMALVVWRTLRRRFAPADAAVASLVLFCAPVFVLSTSMLGNEALCAFLVTAALARTTAIGPPERAARHASATGAWLAAALLTKATALVALGPCALGYGVALRRTPRRAVLAASLVVVLPLAVAAPHFARLLRVSGGDVLAAFSGGAVSPAAQKEMRSQPPGERHLADYVTIPSATFLAPVYAAPGMVRSVPGLLYASTWADAHERFLPAWNPRVLAAESLLAMAGLLPTGIALLGVIGVLRRPRAHAWLVASLALAGALLVALLRYSWILPAYSSVKASYLLSAGLPAAALLAVGLGGRSAAWRGVLRGALLAFALLAIGVTWIGFVT